MEKHNEAVAVISARITELQARGVAFRIFHGSTNSTRESKYRKDNIVDTSGLNHVLKVDPVAKTALVEPNVPMDKLLEATLKYHLRPPVVPEFPGITAGGGYAGTCAESSSYKYGSFDRAIRWVEIVLPSGKRMVASKTENTDLFYGAAESLGTLGVTTLIEIQLVPAKKFVELTYLPVTSIPDAIKRIEEASLDETVDFIDGIMSSKTSGAVHIGRSTDEPQSGIPIARFARAQDDWFYTHAESILAKQGSRPYTEAIPITDYIFRYDRGAFWMGRYMFYYFLTPFNRFTRWLYDSFMSTRSNYTIGHQTGGPMTAIIQDAPVPYKTSPKFWEYLHEEFGIYPIWLCPVKQKPLKERGPYSLASRDAYSEDMLLNFGVWGPAPPFTIEKFAEWNRGFEKKVYECGGRKAFYAHCYYTEKEFNEIYPREEYDRLRKKYGAEGLLTVYQKVKVDIEGVKKTEAECDKTWASWLYCCMWHSWPGAGFYGVWLVLSGGDGLLKKSKPVVKEEPAIALKAGREAIDVKGLRKRSPN